MDRTMTTSTLINSNNQLRLHPISRLLAPATSNWWMPLLTGIAWLVASVVIFRFDHSTVTAVAVLFGIVALASAANEVLVATISTKGWRIVYLLLAALSVAVGIVSFIHPGDTFAALAALISFYLIFRGTFDLIQAFYLNDPGVLPERQTVRLVATRDQRHRRTAARIWAAGSWNASVTVLVAWVGATALLRGITEIVAAFQLRDLDRALPH
jgi:uncharacterized membrane protein HdeD (DUF308 family)